MFASTEHVGYASAGHVGPNIT